jgi:hypothetical protein
MKNLKSLAVGWLLLFTAFVLLSTTVSGFGSNLVSNVDGKITGIILHNGDGSYYSGLWFDMTVLFKDLLEKMDRDVGFVILITKDHRGQRVKKVLKPYENQKLPDGTARVKYMTVDVKTSLFYPWARDGYTIQTDKNNNLIFLDSGFNEKPFPITNWNDVFENTVTHAASVHRGGGNIRTTEKEVFVGIDTILGIRTKPRLVLIFDIAPENIIGIASKLDVNDLPVFKQRFKAHADFIHRILAPDKKMIIPGLEYFFSQVKNKKFKFKPEKVWHTGAQAAYHTDVYLGLGHIDKDGKRVLFVADSNAGAAIIEKIPTAERRRIEGLFPSRLAEEKFTAAGVPVTVEQIARRFQWSKHKLLDLCLEKAKKLAPRLDETAGHLESLGYRVVRVPYLPNGLDNNNEHNDQVVGIGFNYSNVLTEVYGKNNKVRKVYLPEYGFRALDEAAANAYRSAGFQVIIIHGLFTNSMTTYNAMAGLDCLSSEIRIPIKWAKKYYGKKSK